MQLQLTLNGLEVELIDVGSLYDDSGESELHCGDVVIMIDGKQGVVLNDCVLGTKGIGTAKHVNSVVKKYHELTIGEYYLNGNIKIV